jgi:hypothetical protein
LGGSAGVPGLSSKGPPGDSLLGDLIDLNNNNKNEDDEDDKEYDNDDIDYDNDGNKFPPGEGRFTVEKDADACKACLLSGIVCTGYDYGRGLSVYLLDTHANSQAVFDNVELQAPVFFVTRLLVCAGELSEGEPPICAQCLLWNLTVPLLQHNCNR